tara:strand:+ start:8260 stop:8721 length:462 start_codon:yes stop_codon:yes gene_type:complete
MADEIIRRGFCINDTIIQSNTEIVIIDSIVYLLDTFDMSPYCYIDTILSSGTRIVVVDNQLIVKEKQKIITKVITNTETNYIRDKALEIILNKDIQAVKDSLNQSRANVLILKDMNGELHKKLNKIKLFVIGFLTVLVIFFLGRLYFKLTSVL